MNFQMFKLHLEKGEEPEIKLPTSIGSLKKQEFQKNIYFCFIKYVKAFDCVSSVQFSSVQSLSCVRLFATPWIAVDHNKLWKILERWEYQTTLPASWEICMWVEKKELELDMEQLTGSK